MYIEVLLSLVQYFTLQWDDTILFLFLVLVTFLYFAAIL